MRRHPYSPVQALVELDTFALKGGLDLHTPQLQLKPGFAKDAQNYECSINGGYSRIGGYERYDGHAKPSEAVMIILMATATAGLAVGDAINGQTSGATGTVAYIDGLTVAVAKVTGTFQNTENFRKVTTVIGTLTSVGSLVTDQLKQATYQAAVANIVRADIGVVPGSGPVRGGFTYNGFDYAWRNNAGGTAALLYRASGTGWTAIPMIYEVPFTSGSGTAPAEGSTITKGAVSAVVRRVMVQSGTFAGGTAQGRFMVSAPTGGAFSAGAFTAGVTATCSGASTQVSFLPGGRFEHDIGNAGTGVRVYGADGVNRGFEFDGTYVCPITTGNSVDSPLHVRVHKHYLFFTFVSSLQFSGIGAPYTWTIVSGAGELVVDLPITGLMVMRGTTLSGAMAVLTNDSVSILYGTSFGTGGDGQLSNLNAGVGSKAYSAKSLTSAYIYDDLGIASLDAVQAYGNFESSTLTMHIRSFVQQRRTLVTDSLINKEKSQYRVYFSDGYALYMTIINGKFIGAMPIYFPNSVTCSWSGASANGVEISYFGSTTGYVYQMDVGTSFDGAIIDSWIELAFAAQGNERLNKRYRRAVFEMQGQGYAEFDCGYQLSYGDANVLQGSIAAQVNAVYWDRFTWDNFIWDGRAIAPSQIRLGGTAENISLRISGSSALWPAATINSVTLHYTPRRLRRN